MTSPSSGDLPAHTDITEQYLSAYSLFDEPDRDAIAAVLRVELDNGIVILDERAQIRWVNPHFTKLSGYSLDEVRGRVPMSFLSGSQTEPATLAHMLDCLRQGAGFEVDVCFHRKDGAPYWVHLKMRPIRDASGGLVRFVAIGRDISEQQRVLEALRRTEERWEMALRGSGDGVIDFNLRTGEIYRSPRWKEMLGYGPGELDGGLEEGMRLVHPDDVPPAQAAFNAHLRGETASFTHEFRLRCKDGVFRWFQMRCKAMEWAPDGTALRVVGSVSDVTARRELEQSLRQAKETAEAATRAKDEFISNVSHELRTPMNAVLGFSGLLAATPLSEEQRGFVQLVRSSGEHLLRIINDILDLARSEAGTLTIEDGPCDLPAVVKEVLDLVKPGLAGRDLTLHLIAEKDSPGWVLLDSGRLRQVLLNLLGNALKFTERGAITVTLSGDPARGRLLVRVQDTGVGISTEHLPALFTRFTQGDTSRTRRHGGTGLGLAISRQLIELMGGEIGVFSEVGRGSTFWFWLPWRPSEPPVHQPPALAPGSSWRTPLQVVVVDDNATNRLLARRLLEKLGGRVTLAENGREAVALCEQRPFDLIFMDCQMPEMDGFEATTRIRALEGQGSGRRVPIIALTASTLPDDRGLCLAAGMDDFLSKPLRPNELREALARWAPA